MRGIPRTADRGATRSTPRRSAAAKRQGFGQIATGYEAQAAIMEALYGYSTSAHRARRGAVVQTPPRIRAAAEGGRRPRTRGRPARREPSCGGCAACAEEDTLLHRAYLPPAEAAVLLARAAVRRAVEELRQSARTRPGLSPPGAEPTCAAKRGCGAAAATPCGIPGRSSTTAARIRFHRADPDVPARTRPRARRAPATRRRAGRSMSPSWRCGRMPTRILPVLHQVMRTNWHGWDGPATWLQRSPFR